MQTLLRRCLLLLACVISTCSSSSVSYIGAVVEFRPVSEGTDGLKVAEENARSVRTITAKAAEFKTDIIVFPEIGLTSLAYGLNFTVPMIRNHLLYAASYIPDPKRRLELCNAGPRYTKALRSVSCTAKQYKMYVVVNIHEKVDCRHRGCPADGYFLYNSNAVFDRQGRLIARYRKYNLYDEPGVDVPPQPEISIFETDFGVRFGQIICNDILYVHPALDLVREHNVTDIIFPAMWFSELPFITSLQIHGAWAYASDVNLLSSGFNEPAHSNGGSSIFLGRKGAISVTSFSTYQANVLIVAEVPKVINGVRQEITRPRLFSPINFSFTQDEVKSTWIDAPPLTFKDNFTLYTTKLVQPNTSQSTRLCNRGLCCDFNVTTTFANTGKDYYRFRMGVFNGTRRYGLSLIAGVEVCGVFFCSDDTIESCGRPYPPDSDVEFPIFESIDIERTVDNDPEKIFYPLTLVSSRRPVDASKVSYDTSGNQLKLSLTESETNLWSLAIYGRIRERDNTELTGAH